MSEGIELQPLTTGLAWTTPGGKLLQVATDAGTAHSLWELLKACGAVDLGKPSQTFAPQVCVVVDADGQPSVVEGVRPAFPVWSA
jgi:hypothetical protein